MGIINNLKNNPQYRGYLENLRFETPRGGNKSDEAHPPIHPVKNYEGDPSSLEAKIFDLVARRFMANCSKDAVLNEQEVAL